MISLDCEATGLDFRCGSTRPFIISVARDFGGVIKADEPIVFDVDPLTRLPLVDEKALQRVRELLTVTGKWDGMDEETRQRHSIVGQNFKYDITALESVGVTNWPWSMTHDTLMAAHILESNQPHNLTYLASHYLGINIKPLEVALEESVKECRKWVKSHRPQWAVAKEGRSDMPSVDKEYWRSDYWLPRAVAKERNDTSDHPYWNVTSDYAKIDSGITLALWQGANKRKGLAQILKERDLWEIYLTKMKTLPILFAMEQHGVTISGERQEKLISEYKEISADRGSKCTRIAKDYEWDLILPKGANNHSLLHFCFGKPIMEEIPAPLVPAGFTKLGKPRKPKRGKPLKRLVGIDKSHSLGLPVVARGKAGGPSLNQKAMAIYDVTLDETSKARHFTRALAEKRSVDTAVTYLQSYKRFRVPIQDDLNWYRLYPNFNATGTDTVRLSSSAPNAQNVSKKKLFNLRYVFGPSRGREWWACDYENLELRLPAYASGEKAMIELFEHPDNPPFYGSYHMLVFAILHPREWDKHGMDCKELYKDTLYQWTKNGNFAVQYGAIAESGTADRAYHVEGGQKRIESSFTQIKKLASDKISMAKRYGYIETMPDKTVNLRHGYPLMCKRTDRGDILPTTPLSYFIQGTAGWVALKAMIRTSEYLKKLNQVEKEGYYLILNVHDELVYDFPAGTGDKPWQRNLSRIHDIKKLMEMSGEDIGVPLRTSVTYHPDNWSKGKGLKELV